MACNCQNKQISTEDQQAAFSVLQATENCTITGDQLITWKNQLTCVKLTGDLPANYEMSRINSYLGVVLSALYLPEDLCFYKSVLDEMQPLLALLPTEC